MEHLHYQKLAVKPETEIKKTKQKEERKVKSKGTKKIINKRKLFKIDFNLKLSIQKKLKAIFAKFFNLTSTRRWRRLSLL